ncbi:DUF4249 family protein [Muricauda sp. JGD-17]|uniref:DUF4249 family protein n=1 Tax=Flagellimonas ochracea TaxID=2696472 RepID=A0A964TAE7_9FLAO|nr:DUF4249 family protein [Allomuricauda ochracea]NAY90674.1 DUF4249 family protein [Allomuricauda ochracea]
MKCKAIIMLLGVWIFISCEDVIDVNLPEQETRLVVNGLLRVDIDQEFVNVEISMMETSNFFEDNQPTQVESAAIIYGIPDEFGEIPEPVFSNLAEREPGSGVYVPDPNFTSDQRIRTADVGPGVSFFLQITYNDRSYFARTEYASTVPINGLLQGDNTLFDEDETEVIVSFTDVPDQENYYVFDFGFGEFLALDDQFIDGQAFQFSYFYDSNLEPGQEINISILGATQDFYNYMDLLVEQTDNNGGVFQTPIATARGNVFDITDLDNIDVFDNVGQPELFALGYFAVVQEFTQSLIIE